MIGDLIGNAARRTARLSAQRYVELKNSDARSVLETDAFTASRGALPSPLTQDAVYAASVVGKRRPRTSPTNQRSQPAFSSLQANPVNEPPADDPQAGTRAWQRWAQEQLGAGLRERERQRSIEASLAADYPDFGPSYAGDAGETIRRNIQRAASNTDTTARALTEASPLGFAGIFARDAVLGSLQSLDRPRGAVIGALGANQGGAVGGFVSPGESLGRDLPGIRNLSDRDVLPLGLSARDVVGGVADIVADPLDIITGSVVTDVARLGRGVGRRAGASGAAALADDAAASAAGTALRGAPDNIAGAIPAPRVSMVDDARTRLLGQAEKHRATAAGMDSGAIPAMPGSNAASQRRAAEALEEQVRLLDTPDRITRDQFEEIFGPSRVADNARAEADTDYLADALAQVGAPDIEARPLQARDADYLYHVTPSSRIAEIQQAGLAPPRADGLDRASARIYGDGSMGRPLRALYAADNVDVLRGISRDAYLDQGDQWVALRFKPGRRSWRVDPEFGDELPGAWMTRGSVGPDEIEVLGADGWRPLSNTTVTDRYEAFRSSVAESIPAPIGGGATEPAARVLTDLYGIDLPKRGLTVAEQAENQARRLLGKDALNEEGATRAFKDWDEWVKSAENVGNNYRSRMRDSLGASFDFDKQWRVRSVAGQVEGFPSGATIQDIAARRADFDPFLTPQQRSVLDALQAEMAPFEDAARLSVADLGTRRDVGPGGFYMHRAYEGNVNDKVKTRIRGGGKKAGGREGFEKAEQFASMEEAIADGWQPKAPWDATGDYVEQVGRGAASQYAADFAREALGGATAASRVPAGLRDEWTRVNRQARSARRTLERQETRLAQQVQEAERAGRAADQAAGRAARAAERAPQFIDEDLKAARAVVDDTFREARKLAADVRDNANRLRTAGRELTAQERALLDEVDRLDNLIAEMSGVQLGAERAAASVMDDAAAVLVRALTTGDISPVDTARVNLGVTDALNVEAEYRRLVRAGERAEREIDRITDRAAKMADRVDKLTEQGAILGDLDRAARQQWVEGRRAERALYKAERQAAVADREVALLDATAARMRRNAQQAGNRALGTQRRMDRTQALQRAVAQRRADLKAKWDRAQKLARQTPRDRGTIDLAELQGTDFPISAVNAANRIIRQEMREPGVAEEVVQALANLYRGLTGTLDNSVLGNQLLLMSAGKPRVAAKAARVNAKAWARGGDRALGEGLNGFDNIARKGGMPESRVWARNGLGIAAQDPEFALGRGFAARLANAPGVRQANRAFGTTGTMARYWWAQSELEHLMKVTGKTWQQLDEEGELRRIANAINSATGYSDKRFGGFTGELLLYAPRYLQSRLETVARGAMGLRPGATLEQRIARAALLKLIGHATWLTVAVNAAQGRDTDFRPFANGGWNSNFLRIRAGGRDWSLLGPWDSLARAITLTATGKPHDAIKGMASGPVRYAWDFINGQSFDGPVPNTRGEIAEDPVQFAKWIVGNAMPFFAQDVPELVGGAVGAARRGDVGGALGQVGVAAGTFIGAKEAPATITERLTDAARDLGINTRNFYDLPQSEQNRVLDAYPDLARERTEQRIERGGPAGQYEQFKQAIAEQQAESDRRLAAGEISRDEWVTQYRNRVQQQAGARDIIYADSNFKEGKDPEDQFYAEMARLTRGDGSVDWDELDAWLASKDDAFQKRVDEETGIGGNTPEVAEYRAARKAIDRSGYYDLRDRAWSDFLKSDPRLAGLPDDYWAWRDAEVEEIAKRIRDEQGLEPDIARRMAADEVAGYATVRVFNEYYRTQYRHSWVVDNPELARQAWAYGIFKPDKAEQEFLLGQRQPVGR